MVEALVWEWHDLNSLTVTISQSPESKSETLHVSNTNPTHFETHLNLDLNPTCTNRICEAFIPSTLGVRVWWAQWCPSMNVWGRRWHRAMEFIEFSTSILQLCSIGTSCNASFDVQVVVRFFVHPRREGDDFASLVSTLQDATLGCDK